MADWVEKFVELTSKTHSEQGIWWLNGFWEEGAKDYAEAIWTITHQFIECEIDGPVLYGSKKQVIKEGCDLDELKSHRILEIMGETMTVVALRKRLKDLDIDNNHKMALSELLLDKYKKTPQVLVKAPQGDVDPVELAACQKACDDASDALDEASSKVKAAATALSVSQAAAKNAAKAKASSDTALASAAKAEAEVKAAEAELQAAVDAIEAIEKEKADLIAKCDAIINDPANGTVKKGRAVQEKETVLAEDPLPLRKAKITQIAALKKLTKARKIAEEETATAAEAAAKAATAKNEADAAEKQAGVAKKAAEVAKVAAEEAFAAAQKSLDDLKAKGGHSPQGKLWWMERILKEKKKFSKN